MDFDDIVKIVDQVKVLEARLAVAEAEREKYQGLADNRLNCMALYRNLIGKHEARIGVLADKLNLAEAEREAARAASEKDREWVGRALEKQAEYLGQSQMLVAERDAAQAGEARAVEALRKLANEADALRIEEYSIRELVGNTNWSCLRLRIDEARALDAQPALDWLTQQRREAAAEVVNALADGCERAKRPILAQELRGHVAALRAGATGGVDAG